MQVMLYVAVLSELQGEIQTEKNTRNDVYSRPFRTFCTDKRTVWALFQWSGQVP